MLEGLWQSLLLDFLTGVLLCDCKGITYDLILVIVDRYTKAMKYIPTTKKIKADELSNLFAEHVLYEVGALKSLISDQDSLFTSDYWRKFCSSL